jgi:hypothetical protein
MASIEIDFDVYKALTLRRAHEGMTYNDVLRDLLDLGGSKVESVATPATGPDCILQGIAFPEGTKFRVSYKGRTFNAEVKKGQWVGEDGQVRRSPSDAASAITHTNVNGWRFWSFKRPSDGQWRKMSVLQAA